jgi:hypothetical protein
MLTNHECDRLAEQMSRGEIFGIVTRDSRGVPVLVHGSWLVNHSIDDGVPVSPSQAARLRKASKFADAVIE